MTSRATGQLTNFGLEFLNGGVRTLILAPVRLTVKPRNLRFLALSTGAGICDLPVDWPWSSYRAMVGHVAPPPWLHVQWLLAQFGNSAQTAIAVYVNHVRDGVDLPSIWEQLQGQLYLSDAELAEVLGRKRDHKRVADAEIPRLQRRISMRPLAWFAAMPERNTAIVQGWATGWYTIKEIAQAFEIHYARVSRIVKKSEFKKYE